jgi:hypothetical protein
MKVKVKADDERKGLMLAASVDDEQVRPLCECCLPDNIAPSD